MSTGIFGEYQSQTTKQLKQISSSKYPDTNKDFEANLQRLNHFVDYIAQYLTQMQKGVDQANADPIRRTRDMIADFAVLLGGGELLYGIDLGDLQYFLPALGALFGFDSETPFPINLFHAAQRFFLGYVVPLDAFLFTIQDIINGWATALGLDPEFVAALNEVMDELIELGTSLMDILTDLFDLLDIFGINTGGFGPFADIWHAVTKLLGAFDLTTLGNLIDPVLSALAPWLHELAQLLNTLNNIIDAFSGGTTDLEGILNFANMFTPYIDFVTGVFDPVEAWIQMVTSILEPSGLLANFSPLNAQNLFNIPWLTGLIPLGHLGNVQEQNLIDDPHFIGASSVVSSVFTWDGTTTHSSGVSGAGSAMVTADGTVKELLSNRIPVDPGQELKCRAWAKWTAMTATGTPIRMGLTYYLNNSAVAQPDLVSRAATPTTTDWIELLQASTIAPDNVDSVVLRLTVGSSATAGTVHWSDTYLSKPSKLLPTNFIDGLDDLITEFQDNITNLFDNLLGKLDISEFTALKNVLGGDLTQIGDRLDNFLDNLSPLNADNISQGNVPDQFVSGVRNILNNLVAGFRNVPQTIEFSHTDLANTAQAQAAAITGLASQVSQLSQTFTSGVTEGDDFERVSASNLGSGWIIIKSGSGSIATPNGHDASWIPSGSGNCDFVCIRNAGNLRSATDFQSVEMVLASAPTSVEIPIFQPLRLAFNDIWFRISDDTTSFANITGIRYRFSVEGIVYVHRFVSGVSTELTSGDFGLVPGAGTVLGGYAGKAGTARFFEPRLNYRPAIAGISEVGVASGLGAAHRRWGFGGRVEGYLLPLPPSQTLIGAIRQWSAQDQFQ